MTTLRAHFDGKVLVPLGPVELPKGRVLEVEVRDVHDVAGLQLGSPALLLKIMHEEPHLADDDVLALERSIDEGKLPVRYEGIFDEGE